MALVSDVRSLWHAPAFRRLTYLRLLSQGGDGMFQVGIVTAFFFDPTQAQSKEAMALGFLVLLAPFTIIGPFVGPLIDRWSRQRILLWANLVRVALCSTILVALNASAPQWVLYTCALLALSLNRFTLAAITAGLPRVVSPDGLLTANAVSPTLGSIAATVGAGIGAVVTFFSPASDADSIATAALVGATVSFLLAGWIASWLGKHDLGPATDREENREGVVRPTLSSHLHELKEGFTYLIARKTPAQALAVMAVHRGLYVIVFVSLILMSRQGVSTSSEAQSALGQFGIVLAISGAGFGLAAIVSPLFKDRITRHSWVIVSLTLGAVGQLVFVVTNSWGALLVGIGLVSYGVQAAKIAIDTIVQRDTEDQLRGRAFILYDMAFNIAFMAAAVAGALLLPASGYSQPVMASVFALYLVTALAYSRAPREPSTLGRASTNVNS